MEILEAIKGRRSIRKYQDKDVEVSKVKKIIENALWAPSPMNRQPWKIVVIFRDENYSILRQAIKGSYVFIEPDLKELFAEKPHLIRKTKNFLEDLGEAPVCILTFLDSDYENEKEFSMVQGVSAVIQNICLLAYSEGLGTCWMTAPLFVEDKVRALLKSNNIMHLGKLVAVITMGYPMETPKIPPRKEGRIIYL